MAQHVFLQVDGGGILGITPAMVLAELESRLRAKSSNPTLLLRDRLAFCCGTSTGAIISGLVAAGVDASGIAGFYNGVGIDLFEHARNPLATRLWRAKFKRDDFTLQLDSILSNAAPTKDANLKLGQIPKNISLVTTAYNLSSHRTHFIKSSDESDRDIRLSDAIAWSALSAAFYFGKINVPNFQWDLYTNDPDAQASPRVGAVFQDGGQGTQNCTLDYVLTEILARNLGTQEDPVVIISLGTGNHTKFTPYSEAQGISDLGQTARYLLNQARDESTTMQELAGQYVAARRAPGIKLFRLDYEADADYGLDDTDHVDVYRAGAARIIASKAFSDLLAAL